FIVVFVLEVRHLAGPSLRFLHDAPALRDLRRIIGEPDLVVKQLTARCPPQQRDQSLGTVRPVDFAIFTHTPALRDAQRSPRAYPTPSRLYTSSRTPWVVCATRHGLLNCKAFSHSAPPHPCVP